MNKNSEKNKPSLKATLSGGMRGLMEDLEKEKAKKENIGEEESPAYNAKSFSETLDYYKRISPKSISAQVILDSELKRKLDLLRVSREFNCSFKVLLSAIVKNFLDENKDLIKRNLDGMI